MDSLERELRANATKERALKEKAYLKSALEHIGATVPTVRKSLTGELSTLGDVDRRRTLALARALWRRPIHELRSAAAILINRKQSLLHAEDIELLERFLREAKTWAIVDELAVNSVSAMVVRMPELNATLDRWAMDDDFWIRRSAILALLKPLRKGQGDFVRFSRYADAMLVEKEFFIRKAIGWILREYGRKRPREVAEWLTPRVARASGVTIREAVKYLSERDRNRLLQAYRTR